ncbi:MAG TPA: WYL domain-containing protein [Thermoanaerobaculia bacterium]|nr:WYL domain-containing protein [Thermoanaerobaculia bacterium]
MRADRLLSILLQLQMRGRMTTRDLAKRLEVTERTIHRDMTALGSAGVPVFAERGARGGWRLMDGYRTNLTGLSEGELQALFVARPEKLLADLHVPRISRPDLARERIFIDITGWNRGSDPVPHLSTLLDAVWRDRKIRILYGDDVGSAERILSPLGLVAKGSVWYLVAQAAEDVRSYRVSRVRGAWVLDESFVRPAAFDLERFWNESAARFKERLPRFDVVVRTTAVEWLRRMMRYGAIDAVEGDVVRLHFDSADVARIVLLGMGDQVEVLDPPSLRESIVAAARAIITGENR